MQMSPRLAAQENSLSKAILILRSKETFLVHAVIWFDYGICNSANTGALLGCVVLASRWLLSLLRESQENCSTTLLNHKTITAKYVDG